MTTAAICAIAATLGPIGPEVAAAPGHSIKVWRIERVDDKPRRLKVSVRVADIRPGALVGDVSIKRVGRRWVPYRLVDGPLGYGYLFEMGGGPSLVPAADVDEGPVHATAPTCADLGIDPCAVPDLGLPMTTGEGAVGWYTDTPIAADFYVILYDMTPKGSPTFDKAYPGWRAVPVTNLSVTVVTRRQAEATGATNGYFTVEHFHRAAVRSSRGYSVVQAILPCFGRSGPGVGSARLTNSRGLSVPMDCSNHPLHVAVASGRTDWELAGDVVGVNQQLFPYSRLIQVNLP